MWTTKLPTPTLPVGSTVTYRDWNGVKRTTTITSVDRYGYFLADGMWAPASGPFDTTTPPTGGIGDTMTAQSNKDFLLPTAITQIVSEIDSATRDEHQGSGPYYEPFIVWDAISRKDVIEIARHWNHHGVATLTDAQVFEHLDHYLVEVDKDHVTLDPDVMAEESYERYIDNQY